MVSLYSSSRDISHGLVGAGAKAGMSSSCSEVVASVGTRYFVFSCCISGASQVPLVVKKGPATAGDVTNMG